MLRKHNGTMVSYVQYACYVIGEEYRQRKQREAVWGQLRRS